jgi:hypothetical protein
MNDMKKNTIKLTEAKLKQIIRESIENYIKENEDIDWAEFDDFEEEWDGSWAGRGRTGEDYAENPSSEEMIWKHYGNQNIHKDKPGEEGIDSILAQGDKNTFARHMSRSVRPTNADFEDTLYRDWSDPDTNTSEDDIKYLSNKLGTQVYESVKRKLRRIK